MAGGTPNRGEYGAQYFATKFAKQGDLGSKVLKPRPTGVVWTAGETVEVSWAIEANHGGGYQYRLCKRDDPLGLVEVRAHCGISVHVVPAVFGPLPLGPTHLVLRTPCDVRMPRVLGYGAQHACGVLIGNAVLVLGGQGLLP